MKTNTIFNQKFKREFKRKGSFIVKVFFGDARQTWERIATLGSAVFWTWLELSFMVFLLTWLFGIAGYVTGGTYAYSIETLRENHSLITSLTALLCVYIFITRVRIHYGKEIKK